MVHAQKTKFVAVTPPGAIVDNAAFTTNVVDCRGYSYLTLVVQLGALDIALAALKLQESNVAASATALTSGTDISGTVGGTDFTLPSATDDNKFIVFHVNLIGRSRYIDLVMTGGDGSAGTYANALAILSRGQDTPDTAAEAGALLRIVV